MSDESKVISIKGKKHVVRSIPVGPKATVVVTGGMLKTGRVHDEYWLDSSDIPQHDSILEMLKKVPSRPDIYTFAQKLPDIARRYSYRYEWDNYAVAHFESYSDWYGNHIDRNTQRNIKKSAKEKVKVDIVSYSDDYVKGICSIYNELEVRQGKKFWHYGKDFETVKKENATYLDRSVYLGAYFEQELIGFIKMVIVDGVAILMQILSKAAYYEKRPTNALLSKAVDYCDQNEIRYLVYGEYVYGNKEESSLIDFKRKNGFEKVDIPRYYVPLTLKGRLALRMNLHKGIKAWIPASAIPILLNIRSKWLKYSSGD